MELLCLDISSTTGLGVSVMLGTDGYRFRTFKHVSRRSDRLGCNIIERFVGHARLQFVHELTADLPRRAPAPLCIACAGSSTPRSRVCRLVLCAIARVLFFRFQSW